MLSRFDQLRWRTGAAARRVNFRGPGMGAVAALTVYLAAAVALFGGPLLHPAAHECVCLPGTEDEGIFTWAFAWWPHAIWHGLNPFYTRIIYAPQGFDIAHGALVPGAALALSALTAAAGPLASFDVAMVLSPALAAFFAYLLCRRLTHAFWPSLLGGWLFGFSSYMLGQLGSHLHMTLVFLVPAAVHLVIRALDGDISRRRFIPLLALVLVLQFSFSVEVLASLTLYGAVALLAAYLLGREPLRARLRRLLAPIALAYLAGGIIVSPYLYYALKSGALPAVPARVEKFSNDLLAFVVPTEITRLGGMQFLSTSARFTAGFIEGGTYLGVPLLVMTVLGIRAGWRRLETRVMAAVLLVAVLCSLGPHLHVNGATSIPLPWTILRRLPALEEMLPSRFALYASLICSIIAASWLARSRFRPVALALGLVSVASLWPAVGHGYWRGIPDIPALFKTSAYRHVIGAHDTALVLPVGIDGASMLWQAEANLGFRMASGYVVPPEAPDPYKHFAIYPTLTYGAPVPNEEAAAARFLAAEHVSVAVLDLRTVKSSPWIHILEQLGWTPRRRGGVVLLRPPRSAPRPQRATRS